MQRNNRTAIIALTINGARLGERLQNMLVDCDLFIPARYAASVAHAKVYSGNVGSVVERAFETYSRLVLIFALGIAVRVLAALVADKRTDPAVVVVDEKGQFAISVLSGHLGGANNLARQIALAIGAIPVVTTASDANGLVAIDLLGREFGWRIENWNHVTRASAAVVNGEMVGFFQDAGEPLPDELFARAPNITRVNSIAELLHHGFVASLIVTDKILEPEILLVLRNAVVYRPRSLVVGIGCNRGTPHDEIESTLLNLMEQKRLSATSIRNLATIDLKRSERGLTAFAARHNLPIEYFARDELNSARGVVTPSETVLSTVGCRSVCEAAALLSARADNLLVPKIKSGNITIAIARVLNGGYARCTMQEAE